MKNSLEGMDLNDLSSVPERKRSMPENPAEITGLKGKLSDDQHKVAVTVELSNGSTTPDIEIFLYDAKKHLLGHSTILENFGPRLAFTLHTRQESVLLPLKLVCSLNYLEGQVSSQKEITIEAIG